MRDGLRGRLLAVVPGSALLTVLVLVGGFGSAAGLRFTLFDDAMISMTYARTLAETGEWVWHPGAERVQGFTNPLWTLLMTLVHLVGLRGSGAALTVSLAGVGLLGGCGLIVGALIQRAAPPAQASAAAVVATAATPLLYPLAFWALRGMEVGLLAFLALALVWHASSVVRAEGARAGTNGLGWVALVGGLGVATRLDFLLLFTPIVAWLVWWTPGLRPRLRVAAIGAAPVVLVTLGILGFQQVYWGDWLPNTYRLKMDGFGAADRLIRGLAAASRVLPVLVVATAGLTATLTRAHEKRDQRVGILLGTLVGAAVLHNVWVGGDAWEDFLFANRYLSVMLPAALALSVVGLALTVAVPRPGDGRRVILVGVAAVLSAVAGGVTTNPLGWNPALAGFQTAALLAAAVLLIYPMMSAPSLTSGRTWSVTVLVGAILIAVASVPVARWMVTGQDFVRREQAVVDYGLAVRSGTRPGAVVAVIAAGSTVYFAERPAIDLLGKSDRRVASGPVADIPAGDAGLLPYSTLYPGHNKWQYDYSVRQMRPDVLVGWWGGDAVERQLLGWGYQKRCLEDGQPILLRSDSLNIEWGEWAECRD